MAKKKPEKATTNGLLQKLRAKFGAQSAITPAEESARSQVRGVIRTGIDVVDHYLYALGGMPRGRWTELFSDEGAGKTTASLVAVAACQRDGGDAVYCDAENSWDEDRAKKLGVNLDTLILLQPDTMEEAMEQMNFVAKNADAKRPMLIVYDSVAADTFAAESIGKNAGNYSKEMQDVRARKVGQFCRTMKPLVTKAQLHMLCINQTRMLRGSAFGPATTTPAGKALKFLASTRIQLWPGKSLKDANGRHVGKVITFQCIKTRFSEPFRKAKIRLDYDTGFNNVWSTINHAKDMRLIDKGAKVSEETYAQAIEKLGWKGTAPYTAEVSSEAEEDFSTDDEGDGLEP